MFGIVLASAGFTRKDGWRTPDPARGMANGFGGFRPGFWLMDRPRLLGVVRILLIGFPASFSNAQEAPQADIPARCADHNAEIAGLDHAPQVPIEHHELVGAYGEAYATTALSRTRVFSLDSPLW